MVKSPCNNVLARLLRNPALSVGTIPNHDFVMMFPPSWVGLCYCISIIKHQPIFKIIFFCNFKCFIIPFLKNIFPSSHLPYNYSLHDQVGNKPPTIYKASPRATFLPLHYKNCIKIRSQICLE